MHGKQGRPKGSSRARKLQKRESRRKVTQGRCSKTPKDRLDHPLPDRRLMERVLRQFRPGSGGGRGDLSRAQELIYQALETNDEEKRIQIAQQALATCPDCADAYVLLAESTDSLDEALHLYEEGIAAGRRALGNEFDELVGYYWGHLETRPYMRARAGLADTLWLHGRRDEAVGHYVEMLRLNPDDNQGIRYRLLSALIDLGRDAEARALLNAHDESSASWAYSRVLLAFRQKRDSPAARELLSQARKVNRHVVTYLLGDSRLPAQLPEYFGFGDENEAMAYAADALRSWKGTPGAITWLRQATEPTRRRKGGPEAPVLLPIPSTEKLSAVPKTGGEVWQVGCRPLNMRVREGNQLRRTWLLLAIESASGAVLATHLQIEPADADTLRKFVAMAITSPTVGPPHRPGEVQVNSGDDQVALSTLLDPLNVTCILQRRLELLDEAIAHFEGTMGGEPPSLTGLLDVPGISPNQVSQFFDAAAAFFRRQPWHLVAGDRVFRVDAPGTGRGPWYGTVMGQSGMELGFALYDEPKFLKKLLAGKMSDRQSAEGTSALSVTFCEEHDLPPADLDAIAQFGWPIASPEGFPLALRINPGPLLRSPDAWEIDLLTECLKAIPRFLAASMNNPSPSPISPGMIALSWVNV